MQLLGMLRVAYVLFAALGVVSSYAQNSMGPINIEWKDNLKFSDPVLNKTISVFYFRGAVFNDPATWFPYAAGKIKLKQQAENVKVSFQQVYFEEVGIKDIAEIAHADLITDSIVIHQDIAWEQKESYLMYSFVPLRRNPVSRKIERLKYYTLNYSAVSKPRLKKATVLSFASQSVLSSGDWFKFYVNKSGVYKISYSELSGLGLKDLSNVRVYGNGGKRLPEIFNGIVCDDLKEVPVSINTGADGVFNDGDYIMFYAEGPTTYTYNSVKKTYTLESHPFEKKVTYFVTSKPGGAKVLLRSQPSENSTTDVTEYDELWHYQKYEHNLLRSGSAWYGEELKNKASHTFTIPFSNLVKTEPVLINAEIVGRSGNQNNFTFYQNNKAIGSVSLLPVLIENYLTVYARSAKFENSFTSATDNISLQVVHNRDGDLSGVGWIGFVSLTARQSLVYPNKQFVFKDRKSVAPGAVVKFQVSNMSSDIQVWDVADLNQVVRVEGVLQNGIFSFTAQADNLREYIAFDPKNGLYTPEFPAEGKGKVENQNLHGTAPGNMVIVSHPSLLAQANELASLHLVKDGISSLVVTTDQIYNEFSSGMQDPAAIRNFMKMFYDRGSSRSSRPDYLLLFGDGSYDNRTPFTSEGGNSNLIITYESANSLHPTSTFVSDDYFGLLDDGEAIVSNPVSENPYTTGLLDIGIGRLPVRNVDEARVVLNKIKKYYDKAAFGDWRNRICFIGDDEDDNIHMQQADELAGDVKAKYPSMNLEKIYLDAYQQISSSTGQRYPEANIAIQNQLNRGALIVNYTGHGGERGLTHEMVIRQKEDINIWKNENYPLFVTATCDFARFDSNSGTTAGEDVLLNPSGGGIALLTTNRLVYSAPNFVLNREFYEVGFSKSENNPSFRLGDIIRLAKNASGSDINKLNFALLGDPALRLSIPKYSIVTDSINNHPTNVTDTLRAYSYVTLTGHIEDGSGNTLQNFNGSITPTLFDKEKSITSLANDGGDPFRFKMQNNLLFKGNASVKNGRFTLNFVIPRDMDYSFGKGRVSYYASDSTSDASGFFEDLVVGGVSGSVVTDNKGPAIKLYMNDTTFVNGGLTNETPRLLAKVKDDNGINPGGNSIGHDITVTIDNDPRQTYVLNNFYQSDLDNYTQGSVNFQFPVIEPGEHIAKLKIWDIFNNSSEAEIKFKVLEGNKISIQNVYNYPNPFSTSTYFVFDHNQALVSMVATIVIYSMTGSKMKELKVDINSGGFSSGPILWDGTDGNGKDTPGGIYFYRVRLNSPNGTILSSAKKIIRIKP